MTIQPNCCSRAGLARTPICVSTKRHLVQFHQPFRFPLCGWQHLGNRLTGRKFLAVGFRSWRIMTISWRISACYAIRAMVAMIMVWGKDTPQNVTIPTAFVLPA
mmetsp:Transcript_53145/g.113499  ORF Transcript_53145/g.113499 Transcript_53145/m.113499 type:complete len:104 (+) Transcript_53145:411-722(+)